MHHHKVQEILKIEVGGGRPMSSWGFHKTPPTVSAGNPFSGLGRRRWRHVSAPLFLRALLLGPPRALHKCALHMRCLLWSLSIFFISFSFMHIDFVSVAAIANFTPRKRERERERERHTHTHTHTQRHRQKKDEGFFFFF